MHAASRSSIHPMKARALPIRVGPPMAIGNNRAVMATRNSEIPSTPTAHEIPKSLSHECWLTNWKPGLTALEVDDQIGDEAQLDHGHGQTDRLGQMVRRGRDQGDRERALPAGEKR